MLLNCSPHGLIFVPWQMRTRTHVHVSQNVPISHPWQKSSLLTMLFLLNSIEDLLGCPLTNICLDITPQAIFLHEMYTYIDWIHPISYFPCIFTWNERKKRKYVIRNCEDTVCCGFETRIEWAWRRRKRWGFETAVTVWLTANQKWWPAVNIVSPGVLFGTRMEFWGGGSLCIWNAERLSLYLRKRAKNWGQNSCSSGKLSEKSPKIWFHA
jgi:hypothetical protein